MSLLVRLLLSTCGEWILSWLALRSHLGLLLLRGRDSCEDLTILPVVVLRVRILTVSLNRGSLLVVSLLLHLHLVRVLHVSLRRLLLRLLLGFHRDEIKRLLLFHAKVAHLLSDLRC